MRRLSALALLLLLTAAAETPAVDETALQFKDKGQAFVDDQAFTGVAIRRFTSGEMKRRVHYRNGWREGRFEQWFENGALYLSQNYHRGFEEGPQQGYWPNGTQKFFYTMTAGQKTGDEWNWYSNGKLYSRGRFKDGREIGLQEAWFPKGDVQYRYTVVDGRRFGLLPKYSCLPAM